MTPGRTRFVDQIRYSPAEADAKADDAGPWEAPRRAEPRRRGGDAVLWTLVVAMLALGGARELTVRGVASVWPWAHLRAGD